MGSNLLDNTEVNKVLEKLEQLENEELAVKLLKEFNDQSRSLGLLLMNRDPNLDHEKWKQECDDAQRELDKLVKTINSL